MNPYNPYTTALPTPRPRRPSFGQRMLDPRAIPGPSDAVRFMDAGPVETTIPKLGAAAPMPVTPIGYSLPKPGVRSMLTRDRQNAAANTLADAIAADPLEARLARDPARQASIANQQAGIASMQGIQSRLAADGNAQLGYGGRFPSVADAIGAPDSAPYGRSVMPGVVQRGGVTNVVGVPTISGALDAASDSRIAANEARKLSVADAVAANATSQYAKNADAMREQGYVPGQNYVGGKQYVAGEGMVPVSNYQAARNRMSPEQTQTFDQAKAARSAEMELRKQRQFSRAQFREAKAGRGSIYQDDGGLDMPSTMAAQAFGRNPTLGIGAALGLDTNDVQRQKFGVDQLLAQANIKNAERQTAIEEMLAKNTVDQGEFERGMAKKPMTVDEILGDQTIFTSLSPADQDTRFYNASSLAAQNPDDPSAIEAINSAPDSYLKSRWASLGDNPNWIIPKLSPEQESDLAMRRAALEAAFKKRKLPVPQVPAMGDSFLMRMLEGGSRVNG